MFVKNRIESGCDMRSREMTDTEKREYEKLTENCVQMKLSGNVYGYARVSTPKQSIERQVRNIRQVFPEAYMFKEAYTGTTMNRPDWEKLMKLVKPGDLIVFDSVSRMSRSADEGIEIYFELYEKGIQLVFLKERYIDTEIYAAAVKQSIPTTGNDIADIYIDATNRVIRLLAEKQIRKAFEQAEKEVEDLRQRTKEGIVTARISGKQIGQLPGRKLNVKKKAPAKEKILKYSKSFGGNLSDADVIKLIGINRNTYYKYKKELKEEVAGKYTD